MESNSGNSGLFTSNFQQTEDSIRALPPASDSLMEANDTTTNFKPLNQIAANQEPPKTEFRMKKSPWSAIWRSLVLPGWGQYYNESYWKTPVFVAAAGVTVYLIANNHVKYIQHRDEYNRLKALDTSGSFFNPELQLERNRRENYRDNRDMAAFYLLGIYIISAVDAYVDAHLFDFSVSDDLSLSVLAAPRPSLTLTLNFGK